MAEKIQQEAKTQDNTPQTKAPKKKPKSSKAGHMSTVDNAAIAAAQTPLPSNPRHQPVGSKAGQKSPIRAKHAPVILGNPVATILQAITRLFDKQLTIESFQIYLNNFQNAFGLYMQNSSAMSGAQIALKAYLYDLETSIGTQEGDPRQNHELELLKDYLSQLSQKYPQTANQVSQLTNHIKTYQNRFLSPKDEKKFRGYRQVYIGKQTSKVIRIGYDPDAGQHQMYLIDESKEQVIDQHLYPEQNQEMMQDVYIGQRLYTHLIFGENKPWDEGKMKGVATPKESQIKHYNDVPFGIELAVSVLTPVGVINSAYKLGAGKDLMHPEKKSISNWEKAFAVADLVLILPLGKILKIPGKIATKMGVQSDEAAHLLSTGKKVGDDFVVEVAENSKYAQRFIEAEARLAAKQAKRTEAVDQANSAYQKYKALRKAKHSRKAAKGMDGVLYIKFYPSIDPTLAYQAVKLFFAETQSKGIEFAVWLAKLRQQKALVDLLKNASDDEIFGIFEAMGKIKLDDVAHQQMVKALGKGDLKTVEELIAHNNFKSGFGSVVLKFAKIPYSSSNDLVAMALKYRKSLGVEAGVGKRAGSGSNVAVFEYIDLNNKLSYIIKMADNAGHAEQKIVQQLDNAKIPPENVKRIYSELDICKLCTGNVKDYVGNNTKGFYSFELNGKGRQMWKSKIDELYKYFFSTKK